MSDNLLIVDKLPKGFYQPQNSLFLDFRESKQLDEHSLMQRMHQKIGQVKARRDSFVELIQELLTLLDQNQDEATCDLIID